MDTDVVEQSGAHLAPSGQSGAEAEPGTPEATVDEVDRLLDEVEAALTRLDEGTYGACGQCGGPIEDSRLSIEPTLRTCDACDPEGPGDRPVTPDGSLEESGPHPEPAPRPWRVEAREPDPDF